MGESISIEHEALLAQVNWVKTLACHLVQDENEADDLAQDTFVAALTSPPRSRDFLRAWLATVVRNRAVSRFRSEKRRFRRERDIRRTRIEESPISLLEKAEVHKKLVDALLSLDEPYRSILVLRYFGELTHDQIASKQGLPRGTVVSQITLPIPGRRVSSRPWTFRTLPRFPFWMWEIACWSPVSERFWVPAWTIRLYFRAASTIFRPSQML